MDDTFIRMMQRSREGYSCSQIIMLLGLDARGEKNPDLVRAMAGLAYGCATGRGTCGALTGACCLLALYAAKGDDDETQSDRFPLMQQELVDWFADGMGRSPGRFTCADIVGAEGPAASRHRCGTIVIETYTKVMDILMDNDFDPADMSGQTHDW